jgi:hypothetical protein
MTRNELIQEMQKFQEDAPITLVTCDGHMEIIDVYAENQNHRVILQSTPSDKATRIYIDAQPV